MSKAKVEFYRCIIDSQDFGSDDEYMVSRVFFYFTYKGKTHDLYADVKQTIGTSFEAGTIEVSPPVGYNGPFNHEAFRSAVVDYLHGKLIHIERKKNSETFTNPSSQASYNNAPSQRKRGNTPHIRMYNCIFDIRKTVEFDVGGPDTGW